MQVVNLVRDLLLLGERERPADARQADTHLLRTCFEDLLSELGHFFLQMPEGVRVCHFRSFPLTSVKGPD